MYTSFFLSLDSTCMINVQYNHYLLLSLPYSQTCNPKPKYKLVYYFYRKKRGLSVTDLYIHPCMFVEIGKNNIDIYNIPTLTELVAIRDITGILLISDGKIYSLIVRLY